LIARQSIDDLDDLATYLSEGIWNRRRYLSERQARSIPVTEDPVIAAGENGELRGHMEAFAKVLQILDNQLHCTRAEEVRRQLF